MQATAQISVPIVRLSTALFEGSGFVKGHPKDNKSQHC
jgi:hypothetical protein